MKPVQACNNVSPVVMHMPCIPRYVTRDNSCGPSAVRDHVGRGVSNPNRSIQKFPNALTPCEINDSTQQGRVGIKCSLVNLFTHLKVVKSFVRFCKPLCGCKSLTVRKSLRVYKTLSNVLSPPKTFKLVRVGQRTHLNCSAGNNPIKMCVHPKLSNTYQ